MKEFKRILIANRGEIAIRITRAVQELGMKAIGIYCEEDKLSLFRTKADEAYLIKAINSPTDKSPAITIRAPNHNTEAVKVI